MTDIYHIQISVYVKANSQTGAKAAAFLSKRAIEDKFSTNNVLDEVVIDSVGKEKKYSSDAEFLNAVGKCAKIKVPKTPDN